MDAQGRAMYELVPEGEMITEFKELLEQQRMEIRKETLETIERALGNAIMTAEGARMNTADKIGMYLSHLYEAQRSGHDVHREIDEALHQYKYQLGITINYDASKIKIKKGSKVTLAITGEREGETHDLSAASEIVIVY